MISIFEGIMVLLMAIAFIGLFVEYILMPIFDRIIFWCMDQYIKYSELIREHEKDIKRKENEVGS